MPFVPAPNIVQVEMRALFDGQQVENRIYVDVFHAPTVADMTAIAGAVSNAIITEWLPILPNSVRFTEMFMRSMHVQNGPQATFPFPGVTGQGQVLIGALPNNVSLCVSLRSNFAGRSARGRLYWIALYESVVTLNTVDAAHVTAITEAVRQLDVNITSLGFQWMIVSFISNGVPRPGGPVYFEVNDVLVVDPVVDSQRRRLPGRGT